MLKYSVLVIVLVNVAVIGYVGWGRKMARVVMPQSQTFYFGKASSGENVVHVFELKNDGAEPLRILSLVGSCSCTTSDVSARVISAHSSLGVPVTLKTTRSGTETVTQQVVVRFDRHEPIALRMTGQVVNECPAEIRLPGLKKGESYESKFVLSSAHQPDLRIESVVYDRECLSVSSAKLNDGRGYEFTVAVLPKLKTGLLERTLKIKTNDPAVPARSIAIRGSVREDVEGDVKTIEFGVVRAGAKPTRDLVLTATYDRPFRIERVESDKGFVTCDVDAGDPKSVKKILTLKFSATNPNGVSSIVFDEAHLYYRSGDAMGRLDVPVSAMLDPGK